MPKISKRTVDAAKASTSRYYVWDDQVPGFGLVVHPTGRKVYVFQYRNAEGRDRRYSIGPHGKHTAEQARREAEDLQARVNKGEDPQAERAQRRKAATVGDLLDAYLESAAFAKKADKTRSVDRGRINRHLRPLLGNATADRMAPEDVRKAYKAIAGGKTSGTFKTGFRGLARVTGGEGAARTSVRLLKAIYGWAVNERLISANPIATVEVGSDGQRDLVLDPEQYRRMFVALDELEAEVEIRPAVADAIRVIALTGARRGEVQGMRWRHVDLRKGVAVLPPGEHKTGAKTCEARVIGLPAAAQAIIAGRPQGKPDDFVFPPARGTNPLQLSAPWRRVRARAGLPDEAGLHTLRHSLATSYALAGAEAAQIMAVTGHRDLRTAQRYIHIAKDVRAQLAQEAAGGISALMGGAEPAEVVTLKRGGKS